MIPLAGACCRWVTRIGPARDLVIEAQLSCRWVTRMAGVAMFVTEVQHHPVRRQLRGRQPVVVPVDSEHMGRRRGYPDAIGAVCAPTKQVRKL